MRDDVRDNFNALRLGFLQEPQDLQSFFNLDLNQREFYMKTLEIARNSLDNFTQNHRADGRVSLWFDATDSGVLTATITDNGSGVPANVEPLLFHEPIKSAKDFGKEHFGGQGVGLYDIKSWAQKNGGDITYTNLDWGSKFVLSVSTHHGAYPVDGIGEPDSVEDARERIKSVYFDRLAEKVQTLTTAPNLPAEQQSYLESAADWLDTPKDQLPYRIFIPQAKRLIERLAA